MIAVARLSPKVHSADITLLPRHWHVACHCPHFQILLMTATLEVHTHLPLHEDSHLWHSWQWGCQSDANSNNVHWSQINRCPVFESGKEEISQNSANLGDWCISVRAWATSGRLCWVAINLHKSIDRANQFELQICYAVWKMGRWGIRRYSRVSLLYWHMAIWVTDKLPSLESAVTSANQLGNG